ncbi:MAG: NlpC/P60 family protein [Lentihominibacter sp.]
MGKFKNRLTSIIGIMTFIVLAGGLAFLQVQQPYAITIDGEDAIYVQNKHEAEDVVRKLMEDYTADGAKVKSISLNKAFGIEQLKLWEDRENKEILSKNEAAESLKLCNDADGNLFVAIIVGETKTEEDYTPETKYVKDETMFAGESRTEGETTPGRQIVTRELTTVNGELTEEEVVDEKITEKGTAITVYKGTRGLPEGEDWKTYDGKPLFDNGEDLMDYSHEYLGAPYVKGGVNLATGVDCVGFVRAIYKFYGVSLSPYLKREGRAVSYSNAKPGDIICYKGHYALYLGNGKMIHAANPKKDVCIEKVHGGIIGVRRIID